MSKTTVEDCLALSVFFLNKNGSFRNSGSGTLSWSDSFGNNDCVAYSINLSPFTSDIELHYSVTEDLNISNDIDQLFLLTTTSCFLGKRYWFICSCGKRIAVLYQPPNSNYFRCRHCHNLTYESRNLVAYKKRLGKPPTLLELEQLESNIKRRYYNGKITKKYRRFNKKATQFYLFVSAWHKDFKETLLKKELIS
ncbi:MAG: hypothetical protein HY094_00980 [Candidatus Melainabacteria bacterium]|nr:hypothetical protein [Candidatus Melainabacteria bacterium]